MSETIDLEGLRVTLVDTAGLRETDDVVELEGVARSRGAADVADLILIVSDQSHSFDPFPGNTLLVANKCDLGDLGSDTPPTPTIAKKRVGS